MFNDSNIQTKIRSQFRMTQIGVIVQVHEPISNLLSLSEVRDIFENDEKLSSVLVESSTGTGLILKSTIEHKSNSLWKSLTNSTIDNFLETDLLKINSRLHIKKVMDIIISSEKEDVFKDFLIFHDGKILGIGTYLDLINHVNFLQNMELKKARDLQQFLFEKSFLLNPGFEHKIHTQMAHELGGDFYKLLKIRENYHMIGCFDVSGKNISASLATATISSYFATLEIDGNLDNLDSETIINNLNKVCINQTPFDIYIVGLIIFINDELKTMDIYNLSYTFPYLLKENREGKTGLVKLNKSSKPLGLDIELDLIAGKTSTTVKSGLKLFAFSDGFTDIRDDRGEMFGEERVEDYIKKNYKLKPEGFVNNLLIEVTEYMNETPQVDDMTTLVLSF